MDDKHVQPPAGGGDKPGFPVEAKIALGVIVAGVGALILKALGVF